MKKTNIIFLDVDGVLNCQLYYDTITFIEAQQNIDNRLDYYRTNMCSTRIQWLNDLCKKTNSVVVLSASMRKNHTLDELKEIFKYCGATFEIISKTPILGYERGIEISKWLKDNINPETYGCHYFEFHRYVIIDDDSDMLLNQATHFFQTDNYSGLTPTICYKIEQYFNKFNETNV